MAGMPGGMTGAKAATAEIQVIADQVKEEAEAKENRSFSQFKAIEYASQVVAGTNYFIKVSVGDGEFVHLRVFVSLPHEGSKTSLSAIKSHLKDSDALVYFQGN